MRHAWVVLLCGATACGDDGPAMPHDAAIDAVDPASLTEVALLPNTVNRDLDILFVIDDSPSMLDKQTNLKASFTSFVTALSAGGLPNIHIGVVTTDMGTMGADDTMAGSPVGTIGTPGACAMSGKDGVLQTYTSTMITGKFLSNIGGVTNYTGALTDRFNEIASANAGGCGFEQPMHAMQRALDPANTANAGFLRASARLGVIVLSDEDDCSISHSTMLGGDTATFGPLQSFRCTRFGVTCDVGGSTPDHMNEVGTKDSCHSNEASPYTADVGRYVTLLKGLKSDPRAILFGAIVGPLTPVTTELRAPPGSSTDIPALAHSCQYDGMSGTEYGDPAVRIGELAAKLPRSSIANVCHDDLAQPMTDLGLRLKPLVGDGCLQRAIAQPNVCLAFDVDGASAETPVRACDAAETPPCFKIVEDTTVCPTGFQHLKVEVVRAEAVGDDVWTSVRCTL